MFTERHLICINANLLDIQYYSAHMEVIHLLYLGKLYFLVESCLQVIMTVSSMFVENVVTISNFYHKCKSVRHSIYYSAHMELIHLLYLGKLYFLVESCVLNVFGKWCSYNIKLLPLFNLVIMSCLRVLIMSVLIFCFCTILFLPLLWTNILKSVVLLP